MSSDLHALKFSALNMAANGKKSLQLVEKTPAGNVRWVWNYFSSFKFHLLDSYEFLNFRLWFNQIFWGFFCDYGQNGQVAWQRKGKNDLIFIGSEKKIFVICRSVLSFSHSPVAQKFGTMKQDLPQIFIWMSDILVVKRHRSVMNSTYFLKFTLFLIRVISRNRFGWTSRPKKNF